MGKFKTLLNLILEQVNVEEQIIDISTLEPEFTNQKIAIVPGSFKPPHKGHWEMVMKYLDKVDKVIILISNISEKVNLNRPLSVSNLKPFMKFFETIKTKNPELSHKIDLFLNESSQSEHNLTFEMLEQFITELSADLDESLVNSILSKLDGLKMNLLKSIRKTNSGKQIEPETAQMIFQKYANDYNVRNNVQIRISEGPSPMGQVAGYVNYNCVDCDVYLGSSVKGGDNKRWEGYMKYFDKNPSNTIYNEPVDVQTNLSATELRANSDNLRRQYFPEKISDQTYEQILSLLS